MYSGSDERAEFSNRLISSLVQLGWTKLSPTRFAEQFNQRAGTVDAVKLHGARKWLVGSAIPTQARIEILASWLKVSADWLRPFGYT